MNSLIVIVGTLTITTMTFGDGELSRSLTVEGGFAMRNLIYLVGLVVIVGTLVLAAIGVLNVRNTSDEINLSIDKDELKQKTEQTMEAVNEAGEHVLEDTEAPTHGTNDRSKDELIEEPSDEVQEELVPQAL